MENIKRPTRNETDNDLLKEQERFLKESKKPSVKLVSYYKKSSSQQNHKDLSNPHVSSAKNSESDLEVITGDVLFDVKERDVSYTEPFVFQPSPVLHQLLNKKVKISKFASKKAQQSIFEQMLSSADNQNSSNNKDIDACSRLIDGSGLASDDDKDSEMKKIHEENLSRLSSMTKEEIIYQQEQLKNYLKPEILKFIKKHKGVKKDKVPKLKNQLQNTKHENIVYNLKDEDLPGEILRKEGNEDCDALILKKTLATESSNEFSFQNQSSSSSVKNSEEKKDFEIPVETEELIEGSNKGLWRNMNKIEKEKLEWMTNLPQPKPVDFKVQEFRTLNIFN